MPLISVIVPVYNAAKYLKECVESILRQTFTDFELILVDDGSTDGSGEICDGFAQQDRNTKCIHQENQGVSAARNHGIDFARGKWVTFIDSDDWVESDYFQALVNDIPTECCDMVTSGIIWHHKDGDPATVRLEQSDLMDFSQEPDFFRFCTQELITSPVSKLYLAETIKGNNLHFSHSISYGEDRDFNVRFLAHAQRGKMTSHAGYHYRFVPGSLSNSVDISKFRTDFEYWSKLKGNFDSRQMHAEKTKKYLANRLFHFLNDYISATLQCSSSMADGIKQIKKCFSHNPDRLFLKQNSSLIDGTPQLLTHFIVHEMACPTYLYYALAKKHGKAKS